MTPTASEEPAPVGVLLCNLGTPDAPTPAALRRYLAEFLWDRRVVDLPRPLWWLILHGIILRTRPARSAAAYRRVWTDDGSPLLNISRRQAADLDAELDRRGLPARVELAMRYGRPAIAEGVKKLLEAGCERLLVLPLYPQNSCSTVGSTFDALGDALRAHRGVPAVGFIAGYHDHPAYLDALAASIRETWEARPPGEMLLFSFHGTPVRFRDEGDPYYGQCLETAAAVAERLGLDDERWMVTFQSRFGREEWLQPYTDETLKRLGAAGRRRLDIVCPGFAADCLETLDEIAGENRELFMEAGGEDLVYIPALNDRCDHVAALADLVVRHTAGGG